MIQKKVKKLIIVLLSICALFGVMAIPVSAEEPNLSIFGVYDNDIEMHPKDAFQIHILNTETQEEKVVDVPMTEATENGVNLSLLPGTYAISDIKYTGPNNSIEQNGYGIVSDFNIDSSPDSYSELILAVGDQSASDLQIQYYDTIQKMNGQFVDYIAENTSDTQSNNLEPVEEENQDSNDDLKSENISTEDESDSEMKTEETEKKIESSQKKEINYVAKIAPLFVISILFAAIMYKLRKKNII